MSDSVTTNKPKHPPRWAQRLLSWYCKPELLEDLQGDLNEYFERHCKTEGLFRARIIYVQDVFKFFRPYTLRKPEFIHLLIHGIMITTYIKTSGRSIARNKLFSAINIIGLSVSMSVGLLLIAMMTDLSSYDNFHVQKNRIYRVISKAEYPNESPMDLATTSVAAGKKIQATIPGVEELTLIRGGAGGDARIGQAVLPIEGLWASESFFKTFSFKLLQGNPATALKDPYSLVLTEKSARKLFGTTQVLGKAVAFDTVNYVVTGVVKDIPKLSHLRFEALVSFSTAELQQQDDPDFYTWGNIWSNYVYILLPENADRNILQENLDKLSVAENKNLEHRRIFLSLQPLDKIVLGKTLGNEVGPAMPSAVMWVLGALAFIVILSACFNYTNLSIARSLRRAREVGIRKVVGASKSQVMGQFIWESVIISLLALTFSFLLFLFLRNQFISLDPHISDLFSLEIFPRDVLYFIGLAVVVGITAGTLPAFFFSRIKVAQVLKDLSSVKVFRHISLRKALIVVQYTFSLIFITTTLIGYDQYRNFVSIDLGFTTKNIVNIKLQGNKPAPLINVLRQISSVSDVSQSMMVQSLGSRFGSTMKFRDFPDSGRVWVNKIDGHYLPIHEYTFVAGKNFQARASDVDETEVIVNQRLLKDFNISPSEPEKAIGEIVTVDNKKLAIAGVVRDFHYGTVENEIEPVIFRNSSGEAEGYLNVKVIGQDPHAIMEALTRAWKKIDSTHEFQAAFYDDQIEEAYSQFSVMVKMIGFISFLAICISSLGLFGMVVFTTETRLKEISIRKVLGASEANLIYLLSRAFLILLGIAGVVSLPVTYLFFDKVLLTNIAYHSPIALDKTIMGFLAVMGIALLMIGSQTRKIAASNPAEVLKNE